MNTPSLEAKQAAAIWQPPEFLEFMRLQLGPLIVMSLREAYAEGYDAATAKLREEYEAVLADHRILVRRLDVALNGNGAAAQASLCDIVAQIEKRIQKWATGNAR